MKRFSLMILLAAFLTTTASVNADAAAGKYDAKKAYKKVAHKTRISAWQHNKAMKAEKKRLRG